MMKRIYWVLVSVFLFSCGQQNVTKDILETKEVDDTPYGLAGNTYRNKNLVFKITNLPVDNWAIYADNHPLISELTLDYAKDTNTNQFVVLLLASYPKKEYESRLDESNGILADLEIGMETQTKTDKRSAEDFSNGFMQSYPENEYYETVNKIYFQRIAHESLDDGDMKRCILITLHNPTHHLDTQS